MILGSDLAVLTPSEASVGFLRAKLGCDPDPLGAKQREAPSCACKHVQPEFDSGAAKRSAPI